MFTSDDMCGAPQRLKLRPGAAGGRLGAAAHIYTCLNVTVIVALVRPLGTAVACHGNPRPCGCHRQGPGGCSCTVVVPCALMRGLAAQDTGVSMTASSASAGGRYGHVHGQRPCPDLQGEPGGGQ